jgi:MFS family permease
MDDDTSSSASLGTLVPIMGIVFIGFLIIGMAMPVLPLHVHDRLGLGTFVVGLVAGSQFAASLVSRGWAGRHADERGAKQAVFFGLLASAAAGLLYLLSLAFVNRPHVSVATLLLGRAVLGAGESFIITGAQAWGAALAGPRRIGQVLAWMGTAMYAAFALGAPVGTALYGMYGFAAIALATAAVPLATLALAARVPAVPPTRQARSALSSVVAWVWLPGVGLALSSFGFGAMTAFVSLLFAARGWTVWPAFTTFAVAFILARVLLGHVADRQGGANVALVFVIIEAAGQALLWAASSSVIGLIGCVLTGFGYSLVYPGFGVEAIRRAPRQSRGLAMGAYTAFLDLTLGIASPGLGLIAAVAGIGSVFLTSAVVVLSAAAVAVRLRASNSRAANRQPIFSR